MVDQLTAHAQLRVSLHSWVAGRAVPPHSNELAREGADTELARLAGGALGAALRRLLLSSAGRGLAARAGGQQTFRFCAPLDEAFTELELDFGEDLASASGAAQVALAPYGIYPRGGRSFIGPFRTALVADFFAHLAQALGCRLRARKVRGANAHHIVEATFKSFARCLRKAMDAFCGFDLAAARAPPARPRRAQRSRATKETSIDVAVDLDPAAGASRGKIATGVTTLDELLEKLEATANIRLQAVCAGDLWIDEHHSAEDVAITLGQALAEAIGDKGGVARMGCAEGVQGKARVLCVMDLSNRPHFCSDLRLDGQGEEMVGDASVEMIQHVFESLATSALTTVHLVQQAPAPEAEEQPASAGELAAAAALAMGAALRQCIAVDPRRAGVVSSSKGTLSK